MKNESRGEGRGGGELRSLTAQNNKVILCFQVHDLSDSRKINEIYGSLHDCISFDGSY